MVIKVTVEMPDPLVPAAITKRGSGSMWGAQLWQRCPNRGAESLCDGLKHSAPVIATVQFQSPDGSRESQKMPLHIQHILNALFLPISTRRSK